jgi:hypothetical protein
MMMATFSAAEMAILVTSMDRNYLKKLRGKIINNYME